ncbi:hypothetical protein [Streptomyces sp. NPDC006997]|uniref:hypothetical protein n=1 Tax=Streptomyces sp. NPDC006997 TaxID=3155356 RepID=UPI00340E4682
MTAEKSSSSGLPWPLRGAVSVLGRVPGAGVVGKVAEGTLNTVGAVSPRGRRIAVYTGAGVLGVAGIVEWPVAVTGAAVAWLTQPKPRPAATDTDATDSDTDATEGKAAVQPSGHRDVPKPSEVAASFHAPTVPDTPSGKLESAKHAPARPGASARS